HADRPFLLAVSEKLRIDDANLEGLPAGGHRFRQMPLPDEGGRLANELGTSSASGSSQEKLPDGVWGPPSVRSGRPWGLTSSPDPATFGHLLPGGALAQRQHLFPNPCSVRHLRRNNSSAYPVLWQRSGKIRPQRISLQGVTAWPRVARGGRVRRI